ncbi:hypothetical protein EVAR_156_1 [Eumeta japonica]|uniref:Uncharacterized protein n=1 Tax=Eumeta variegata TaxID=151549 RepID=A0A4C1SBY4_EUMVA|nr:hypothetical protein EVAR_156_1 [Eumeta japonica]
MCIRTVMTYASPVFAHAVRLHWIGYRLYKINFVGQLRMHIGASVIQFFIGTSNSHLIKVHEGRIEAIFDIAGSHPNALLRAAVDYQPPPPTHYIRRPRNVLLDPPDALTAAVDSLNDVNDTHD